MRNPSAIDRIYRRRGFRTCCLAPAGPENPPARNPWSGVDSLSARAPLDCLRRSVASVLAGCPAIPRSLSRKSTFMLLRLIRCYSKPYVPAILAVVVLQLASTIATLYLPSLNARIIDEGVARGDTGYIWRTG